MTDQEMPFEADDIDEQIDLYTQLLRATPAKETPAPDLRLIDDLQQFYPADEAAALSLARVRQRLLDSAPSVSQGEQHARPPARLYPLAERRQRMRFPQSSFHAGQQVSYRIVTIAAAVLLVLAIGSLAAGLVLVHHGSANTGHHSNPQGPAATATPAPASSVYVASPVGIYKFDARTGTIRWHEPISVYEAVPDSNTVYVVTMKGTLIAVNASDGSTRWTITTLESKGIINDYLTIANGVLYVESQTDALLYAFTAGTGKELWHAVIAPTDQGAGIVYEGARVANGVIYGSYLVLSTSSSSASSYLFAASAQDGSVLWRAAAPQEQLFNGPVVANGVVYITSSVNSTKDTPRPPEGYAYAYDLNGRLLWQSQKTKGFVFERPAPGDGGVYFGAVGDAFYAVKMTDGSPLWNYPAGMGSFLAPAQVVGDVVYAGEAGSTQFDAFMLALDATTGKLLWKQAIREYLGSELAASNQTVYVTSDEGILYALSAKDGSQLWSVQYAPTSNVGVNSGLVILGP